MAAETLHRRGIDNFKIIEARETLGGRMKSFSFGAAGREYVLELGADWIHGTQTDNGPSNPIFDLARKHNLLTQPNHYRGSMSMFSQIRMLFVRLPISPTFSNLRPHWPGGLYEDFPRRGR
jgi:polyamine oxidase